MAVIINMDMPKHCGECRLRANSWCYVVPVQKVSFDGRPEWCPLIEINLDDGLYQVQDDRIWKYKGRGER